MKKGAWLREVISFRAKHGTSDIFCGTAFHGHQTTPSLFRVEVHFEVHICAQTVVSNPNDRYPNPLRIRDSEQGERGGNGFVNRRSGVRFPSPAPVIQGMALIRAASPQIPLKSNGPPIRKSAFNPLRRLRQLSLWEALREYIVGPVQIRVHIGCILLQANVSKREIFWRRIGYGADAPPMIAVWMNSRSESTRDLLLILSPSS